MRHLPCWHVILSALCTPPLLPAQMLDRPKGAFLLKDAAGGVVLVMQEDGAASDGAEQPPFCPLGGAAAGMPALQASGASLAVLQRQASYTSSVSRLSGASCGGGAAGQAGWPWVPSSSAFPAESDAQSSVASFFMGADAGVGADGCGEAEDDVPLTVKTLRRLSVDGRSCYRARLSMEGRAHSSNGATGVGAGGAVQLHVSRASLEALQPLISCDGATHASFSLPEHPDEGPHMHSAPLPVLSLRPSFGSEASGILPRSGSSFMHTMQLLLEANTEKDYKVRVCVRGMFGVCGRGFGGVDRRAGARVWSPCVHFAASDGCIAARVRACCHPRSLLPAHLDTVMQISLPPSSLSFSAASISDPSPLSARGATAVDAEAHVSAGQPAAVAGAAANALLQPHPAQSSFSAEALHFDLTSRTGSFMYMAPGGRLCTGAVSRGHAAWAMPRTRDACTHAPHSARLWRPQCSSRLRLKPFCARVTQPSSTSCPPHTALTHPSHTPHTHRGLPGPALQ